MQHRKPVLAYLFLVVTSLGGCDASAFVADVIKDMLSGSSGCLSTCRSACGDASSCASCADCSSCSTCTDCAGCAGTSLGCQPIRDLDGTRQGFVGTSTGAGRTHAGRQVANAMQFRLSNSGYTFLSSVGPAFVSSAVGSQVPIPASFGANGLSPGDFHVELRNFAISPVATACFGNAVNGLGGPHDCARSTFNLYYRTCDHNGACASGETVPMRLTGLPVIGTIDCNLNVDATRGSFPNGLAMRADVGTMNEVAFPQHAGDSRREVFDAQVTNVNSFEGADVQVSCPNVPNSAGMQALCQNGAFLTGVTVHCGPLCLGSVCSIDPSGLVADSITNLRADLNDIVDTQLADAAPLLCQAAFDATDCPSGSTYTAPASGTVGPTNPGSCTITASNPARCVEPVIGVESRVALGAAENVISPGIEAVVDVFAALTGESMTVASGSSFLAHAGIETWLAGMRGLAHDPCVPIEHPAAGQADCDAIGSGYEYEGVRQDGVTDEGRCVPRVPFVPVANGLSVNAPPIVNNASVDADFEVAGRVSEAFVQYAAWKAWDSGAFCVQVGSRLDPSLDPELLASALLAPQTNHDLYFPIDTNASSPTGPTSVELLLHPTAPPQVTFDEIVDPCEVADDLVQMDLRFDALQMVVSIWSGDEYARVGTIEADAELVLDLDVGPQLASSGCAAIARGDVALSTESFELSNARWLAGSPLVQAGDTTPDPRNGKLRVQNGLDTITRVAADLIDRLAKPITLQNVLNTQIASQTFGGGPLPLRVLLDPDVLHVSNQGGSVCSGPPYDTGTRGTSSTCTATFVGAYVDVVAPGAAPVLTGGVDTFVSVVSVDAPSDTALYELASPMFGQGAAPSVAITMTANGAACSAFEFAYRTSYTGWSAWQTSSDATITDRALLIQGNHEVLAMARCAGDPLSADTTSARAPFVIDVAPPMIEVYDLDPITQIQAVDLVSNPLAIRVQPPGGTFGSFMVFPASGVQDLTLAQGSIVEIRDAAGNVATYMHGTVPVPDAGMDDAGVDAGADDAGTDAGPDTDAGADAGADTDAGTDAGADTDAGTDTDAGAGTDAGADAHTDAGARDAGIDSGDAPVEVDAGITPRAASGSGCSCTVAGAEDDVPGAPSLASMMALGVLVSARIRRRRRIEGSQPRA